MDDIERLDLLVDDMIEEINNPSVDDINKDRTAPLHADRITTPFKN